MVGSLYAQFPTATNSLEYAENTLISGDFDEALSLFLKILQSDTASEVSKSRASLGAGMCRYEMGDDLAANKFWSRAGHHAKKAGEAGKSYLAQAYSLRGSLYESWDELEIALAFCRRSLEINKTISDLPRGDLAYAYNNIGAIYFDKADWDKAIEYYTQSHRAYLADSMEVEAALPLTNLGLAWLRKDEFAKAIECFRKAQRGVLQEGDPNLISSLYNNWGLAFVQTGKNMPARAVLQKVLQLPDAPIQQVAIAEANMGFADLRDHLPELAEKWLLKALSRTEGGLSPAKRAKVHLHLCQAKLALGATEDALLSAEEGIRLLLGLSTEEKLTRESMRGTSRDARTLFQLLAARAAAYSAMGNYQAAAESYETAFEVSDQIRQNLLAQGSKLFFSAYVMPVLEAALENEWALQSISFSTSLAEAERQIARIFGFFERNKSLILQEEQQAAEAMRRAGIPPEALETERQLQSDVDFYSLKVFEAQKANDKTAIEANEKQRFEKNTRLDELRRALDRQFPALQSAKTDVFKPKLTDLITYAQREQLLVIEYFWGRNSVYALVVNGEGAIFRRLCSSESVSRPASTLASTLANWDWILTDPAGAEAVLKESGSLLSDSLLKPIFGLNPPGKLLCIPDGVLGLLPLEALPIPGKPQNGGMGAFPYLIRQTEVRYAWSAAMLLAPKPSLPSPLHKAVLAMAPMAGKGFAGKANDMRQLPESQRELTALANHCAGQYLLGNSATKEVFLREAPSYSILHLALHGKLSGIESAFSSLSFGSDSGAVPLYAWEIERLQLPADMVVLSACETGTGAVARGEGVLSLGRSFISQGAKSVVTTLWKVEDKAAAQLMDNFYAALAKGQGRGAALRQAKLDYLAQADDFTAHPAFWAGFVLMGDAGVMEFEEAGNGKWDWIWWAIGPIFAVGVWIWFRRRLSSGLSSRKQYGREI
ncbi:MAG: CHAT domain-containing protein [Bacteroidetes bacterium]|nr:CHAT domain-containing protein [Bacteroidota bacterium]